MPSTAVYFDALPSRIAFTAASLTFSGVSKSGSPAPSPMTSRPAALSARALSVTAMVADGLMRDRRSARKAIARLQVLLRRVLRKAPIGHRQGLVRPDRQIVCALSPAAAQSVIGGVQVHALMQH